MCADNSIIIGDIESHELANNSTNTTTSSTNNSRTILVLVSSLKVDVTHIRQRDVLSCSIALSIHDYEQ